MHRPSRGGNSGRFIEPLLGTGCTPLSRAPGRRHGSDSGSSGQGRSPNINAHGFHAIPGGGRRRSREPRRRAWPRIGAAGGPANTPLLDLLLEHGADVNAQVTGTKTYSMRDLPRAVVQRRHDGSPRGGAGGQRDLVRYLLEKGANASIVDANGRKPIDLVGAQKSANPATSSTVGNATTARAAGQVIATAASAAEIRGLLENAAAAK